MHRVRLVERHRFVYRIVLYIFECAVSLYLGRVVLRNVAMDPRTLDDVALGDNEREWVSQLLNSKTVKVVK